MRHSSVFAIALALVVAHGIWHGQLLAIDTPEVKAPELELELFATDPDIVTPVALDVVIPSPSCPAAMMVRDMAGCLPITGNLSSVAARNPVHTRIAESSPMRGR